MLSIVVLFIFLVISLTLLKINKGIALKCFILLIVNFFLLEVIIYGYFLLLVFKANCFFLIGNQTVLDNLIKTRLSYAIYFSQGKKNFINQVDQFLGYTLGQDKDTGMYTTNKQGFRSLREYSYFPPEDKLRLLALGDSYVFGDGEENKDTWSFILENSTQNLEVLNFGVPGYGLGQSYLRYLRDGLKFNPDIVFINYVMITPRDHVEPQQFAGNNNLRMAHFYRVNFSVEDDQLLSRGVSLYDLFDEEFREEYIYAPLGFSYQKSIWSSPIFEKTNLGVLLKKIVLQKKIAEAKLSTELKVESKEVNIKILEDLFGMAMKNNTTVLLFFGKNFDELPAYIRKIIKEHSNVVYVNSNEALIEQQALSGITDRKRILNESKHYNALGNQLYSKAVLKILKNRSWGKGNRTFTFDQEKNRFVDQETEQRIY